MILGSRSEDRALEAAATLSERVPNGSVVGATNTKATEAADLAPQLAGKVVISCVDRLGFDKQGPYGLDLGPTSGAEHAHRLLPDSRVVGAFHHLSAATLTGEAHMLDHEDVLVCGDDTDAKAAVIELAATVTGKPGVDAGALRLARQLEPLTAVLISVNKQHRIRSGLSTVGRD